MKTGKKFGMGILYVYITGPSGAGKTQFLQTLGGAENVAINAEMGIEFCQVAVDESLDLCLFCSIDAGRFDTLLQIPQRDLLGYILLVDSTDTESWSDARLMLANCRGYGMLPTVITANKQDLPGAHTPEQVGGWIGMASMMRVKGCTATELTSVREVFLQLLYGVSSEIDRLDSLISQIESMLANEPHSDQTLDS
jgi:signal recognition particle receptor subunit beta